MESIVNLEHPDGAVVQFGGQTAIKLTEALMKMGVPILGTSAKDVDAAEDRELFDQILRETKIPRASGGIQGQDYLRCLFGQKFILIKADWLSKQIDI